MKRQSKNYIVTLQKSDVDYENKLAAIKRQVKVTNDALKWEDRHNEFPIRFRTVLRGRKPIEKVDGRGFTPGGDVVGGMKNAAAVDVYIYRR